MSFYTSLTGLNAATTQLSVTSNNIANVGTTGFKRSRADFGDIFATSPLQKASTVIGQGVALKAVTQEFSQGNIQFSASSLDIAITGDGFFPLKSADRLQDIYTRDGTFLLNDAFAVVNSAGQALMAATVDSSGKADLDNLRELTIPRSTLGDAAKTTDVSLALNLPADAKPIVKDFDQNDPTTYNLTTAVTVFDAGGNSYLATVYYVKRQVATPDDPTNKWQTHVFVGNTRLNEFLIQAADSKSEKLFVNKYGEIRAESLIPPQDISRAASKLFNLDDLKNPQVSVPATALGATISTALNTQWKNGINIATEATAQGLANAPLTFKVNVDGSIDPVTVDLSHLTAPGASLTRKFTGVEIARELTNEINRLYGDERYFDFSSLRTGITANAPLFNLAVVDTEGAAPLPNQIKTITLTEGNAAGQVPDLSRMTINEAVTAIQARIQAAADDVDAQIQAAIAAGGVADPALVTIRDNLEGVTVSYDAVNKSFKFMSGAGKSVQLESVGETTNELFGLGTDFTAVDPDTGLYGADLVPNGALLRAADEQRFGVKVTFDDTGKRFNISSGTTGDQSSIRVFEASPLANSLFGFNTTTEGTPVEVSPTPLRGIVSSPAVLSGSPIGLPVDNKFRIDASNNQFVVTVDNVTGLVLMPERADYTIEEFRRELERRINALEDSFGRTVNGLKVSVERNDLGQSFFRFTTGTTGNDSFLKVSANSVWGLGNESVRGSTSRWLEPPQARNAAGFPLYVNREGLETTDPGDFSEEQSRNLWVPIFLDKGELTFDTSGNLLSPKTATGFQPTVIGDSGATLEFGISYDGSTQFSSPFAVRAQNQNGKPEGDLIGLDIGDDGLVSANYSNGTQKNLAKIVLANFTAPTGLRQIGDSSYLTTSQSGTLTLGEAGTAGFGTVQAGARERANVDLTQELIELISAQRNFQANAKAIETNNTLTQAIINIRS
jgi:flagellar hook-basal body protein